MHMSNEPLLDAVKIQRRVAELATEIREAYPDGLPLCLCVLKGSVFFAADLLRHLDDGAEVDFIRAQSYAGTSSTGQVTLSHLPGMQLAGRAVLILEDIVDTGRSAAAILEWAWAQEPASVQVCTLLDKPSRRAVELRADFAGFVIPDHFVVGYGMDYDERYRNLPAIYVLESGEGSKSGTEPE